MKVLCKRSLSRFDSIYRGWSRVFEYCGHRFTLWDPEITPAFDAFDDAPDLYIGGGTLTIAEGKCIQSRKRLTFIEMDKPSYAFDSIEGQGIYRVALSSDVVFVGNYREDKRKLLDKLVLPLREKYRLKIFGHQPWEVPEYLGPISAAMLPHVVASTKVVLEISSGSRHGQMAYLACGNGKELVSTVDLEELSQSSSALALFIDNRISLPLSIDRKTISVNNVPTYFNRVAGLFTQIGLDAEAEKIRRKSPCI